MPTGDVPPEQSSNEFRSRRSEAIIYHGLPEECGFVKGRLFMRIFIRTS